MKSAAHFILVNIVLTLIWSCTNLKGSDPVREPISISIEESTKNGILIEVGPEELIKILKYEKNAFIIDVRNPELGQRSCKSIGNSIQMTNSEIYNGYADLPKNRSIILLSKSGKRGRAIGKYLASNGYSVYNLNHGMDGYWSWREQIIRKSLNIYDDEIDVIELYADDFGC